MVHSLLSYQESSNMAVQEIDVNLYQEKILGIIHKFPYCIKSEGPTKLNDFLYLGDYKDAHYVPKLKDLGITHVLNCAAFSISEKSPYGQDSGIIAYKQFHADDDICYNILKHFEEAKEFLDQAKNSGGRVLVHCAMGINRSGAICAAYLMQDQQMDLIETVRILKQKRGNVLSNRGFQVQLINFAKELGLLPGLKA